MSVDGQRSCDSNEAGAKFPAFPLPDFTLYVIMVKKSVKRKKVGRPATGTEPLYGVRISDALIQQIMEWAKAHGATRSEAIRRLVELGLTTKLKVRSSAPLRAARARDMAAEVLNALTVGAADTEEQADRRRRLLKGPEEFREARLDRPKVKRK